PPPSRPTLFPYTTLFRSSSSAEACSDTPSTARARDPSMVATVRGRSGASWLRGPRPAEPHSVHRHRAELGEGHRVGNLLEHDLRSEEHTSELQSPYDLVC